ncbi:MAG TPA: 50S ribosomal protein L35 [Terriglobales bacterium]|nr:50S ribosomal protein L35 [Terriglobales bacterium]
MPKLKTHKGAQKRFKVTAKKKFLHAQANKSHILTKKASKRKRHLAKSVEASAADRRILKTMLPYDI